MAESSETFERILAAVRPEDAIYLLDTLHNSTLRTREHIASRYELHASRFDDTLAFLVLLGWLRYEGGEIAFASQAAADIADDSNVMRMSTLAAALFRQESPFHSSLARYLSQFDRQGSEVCFSPVEAERTKNSAARNFLISLGVVSFDVGTGQYALADRFSYLGIWARDALGPSSEASLRANEGSRRELGRAAELVVLQWERARVGGSLAHHVVHVSETRPLAAYDIQSVTAEASHREPRFIEVKAVPRDTLRFHWSAAEIEAARVIGQRYFLYLLPVRADGEFSADALTIVQDPIRNVYLNSDGWLKSEADLVCERISSDT
jgi:Domain of unknown function (DUF3883)